MPDSTRRCQRRHQDLAPVVKARSAISSNFNGTSIDAGNTIWFNSHFKLTGADDYPVTVFFNDGQITFEADGTNYTLDVPDAQIILCNSYIGDDRV